MKFISLYGDVEKTVVEESITRRKKGTYIKGPYMQAGVRNENGNLYPLKVVKKAIEEYQKKIDDGTAYGELNHPHKAEINLERICHKIVSLELDEETGIVYGKSKLLDKDLGKKAQELAEEGIRFGVSLRALGSFDRNNVMQDDFELLAVDLVGDPSFTNSMMDVVQESKNYFKNEKGDIISENESNEFQNDQERNYKLLKSLIKSLNY